MSSLHTSNPLRRVTALLLGLASLSMDCAPALKLGLKKAEAHHESVLPDAPLVHLERPDPKLPMTIDPRSLSRTLFARYNRDALSVGDPIAVWISEGDREPAFVTVRRIKVIEDPLRRQFNSNNLHHTELVEKVAEHQG